MFMTVGTEDELMKKVCTYVVSGSYPDESSKNERRIIRRKAKKFVLKHGEIHYIRTNGTEVNNIKKTRGLK